MCILYLTIMFVCLTFHELHMNLYSTYEGKHLCIFTCIAFWEPCPTPSALVPL